MRSPPSTRGKEPPTFLEIGASEAIAERNPVYEATEIKAGAFGGSPPQPEETIETIGVNHYLVARKKLSEDVVADFTKHLFAIRQTLASEVPSSAKIETPDTSKDGPVPVHPGAAAYIDGELKTFFDRYNDLLYWGLMIVSFFGSALAGLASYTKSDDRMRRMKALEQLLDIIASARNAETIQALDELQAETDKIHGDMVREVENNDARRDRADGLPGVVRAGPGGDCRPAGRPDEQSAAAARGGCFRLADHYIAPQQSGPGPDGVQAIRFR